ncbi:MAG: flagellar biosynthesis protein FliC [Melioribacteraceae bacterium]|nr:MAG: flagellar biosynthesis protein FliC [Melioribacteraceae bacterium]
MGFRVNTNTDALQAYNMLAKANQATAKSQLRLASGKRILSVADDTSGFNIGTSLKGKVSVMKGAQSNIAAAKSMLATGEGALMGINDLLTKIEGKLSDATNPTTDRTALKDDIAALANEVHDILKNTKFNDTQLLFSAAGAGFTFQVGESTDTLKLDFASSLASTAAGGYGANISASISSFVSVTAATLASTSGTGSTAALQTALSNLKTAVSTSLGKIGNFTQRLDIKEDTLNTSIANAEASISRLFDADMAFEQLNATRSSILGQAATAMFSQLNFAPQQVLQLLG